MPSQLWQYQQEHRKTLEAPPLSLERWQIGEIASHIGQLYYHYYLRTADASYLREAVVFFSAIRERQYFREASTAERRIKRMRYYARFIVVGLLLPEALRDSAQLSLAELRTELANLVTAHTQQSDDAADSAEWALIVREIDSFLAGNVQARLSTGEPSAGEPLRLDPTKHAPQYDQDAHAASAFIADALLVESRASQIKFSELSLDVFRLVMALEYSPTDELQPGANPHKYLLFRPSLAQLLIFAATALKEATNANGVLLLYLALDGQGATDADEAAAPRPPGLALAARGDGPARVHALHAIDLVPLTRRPLFVLVDSAAGAPLAGLQSHFGLACVVLLAPAEWPADVAKASANIGSLFSLFLSQPMVAFQQVSGAGAVAPDTWGRACDQFERAADAIRAAFAESPDVPEDYAFFLSDPFLARLLVRFVFMYATLSVHSSFRGLAAQALPSCAPALPHSVLANPTLLGAVLDIAGVLSVALRFENVHLGV